MAAHQADDPTLSRPGERIVDTPVNDLISPAPLIRRELRMAAVSVERVGSRAVAGRQTLVLEVRFPSELSKEDHWDLYVDVRTGILLGMVIEPLAGEERYETWIDSIEVDLHIRYRGTRLRGPRLSRRSRRLGFTRRRRWCPDWTPGGTGRPWRPSARPLHGARPTLLSRP